MKENFRWVTRVFLKLQPYRQTTIEKMISEKLAPRYFGHCEIISKVGPVAYTLRLPEDSKVYHTFHVSLLKRCLDPSIAPSHIPADWGFLTDERISKSFRLDDGTEKREGCD